MAPSFSARLKNAASRISAPCCGPRPQNKDAAGQSFSHVPAPLPPKNAAKVSLSSRSRKVGSCSTNLPQSTSMDGIDQKSYPTTEYKFLLGSALKKQSDADETLGSSSLHKEHRQVTEESPEAQSITMGKLREVSREVPREVPRETQTGQGEVPREVKAILILILPMIAYHVSSFRYQWQHVTRENIAETLGEGTLMILVLAYCTVIVVQFMAFNESSEMVFRVMSYFASLSYLLFIAHACVWKGTDIQATFIVVPLIQELAAFLVFRSMICEDGSKAKDNFQFKFRLQRTANLIMNIYCLDELREQTNGFASTAVFLVALLYLISMVAESGCCVVPMLLSQFESTKKVEKSIQKQLSGCDLAQFLCQVILIFISGKVDGILFVKTISDVAKDDDWNKLIDGKMDRQCAIVWFVGFVLPVLVILEAPIWFFGFDFGTYIASIRFFILLSLSQLWSWAFVDL